MTTAQLAEFDGRLLDGLEFCSKAYALFESIRSTPHGPSRFRMRPTSLEKRLLEELLPICKYVQASYRPGRYMSVRWIDGNQQYDAELVQRGAYVSENYYPANAFLEVTCTMHPNEYLNRELLENKGSTFGLEGIRRLKNGDIESVPKGYTNREFVESYARLVKDRIASKASNPYPKDTTLIVQCTLNMPYMPDEWADLMARVQPALSGTPFREIYFYDTLGQHCLAAYPQ
jgi:hypothetical protein